MHFRAYLHAISRYSHFNAQKHETIRRNIGGHLLCCPPTKLQGDMSPRPPAVTAYDDYLGHFKNYD